MSEQRFNPGDTVDPRTLPVGAVFADACGGSLRWRVAPQGWCVSVDTASGREYEIGDLPAILISLPTPKRPPCGDCGQAACLCRLPGARYATKRPPCDACGEESVANAGWETWDSDLTHLKLGKLHLCRAHWHYFGKEGADMVRARRASQTSVVSTLPTYDQIAGWLGSEWVMMSPSFAIQVPSAWWISDAGQSRCYLQHTPTGQRVEVTAPRATQPVVVWERWFGGVRNKERGHASLYSNHVRWLDPDTKTSTGSEGGDASVSHSQKMNQATPSEPVVSIKRCSGPCKQPFWGGRKEVERHGFPTGKCGDCYNGKERIAEVQPEPAPVRGAWSTPCAEGES